MSDKDQATIEIENAYKEGAKKVASEHLSKGEKMVEDCVRFLVDNHYHFARIGSKKAATAAIKNLRNIETIIGQLKYETA